MNISDANGAAGPIRAAVSPDAPASNADFLAMILGGQARGGLADPSGSLTSSQWVSAASDSPGNVADPVHHAPLADQLYQCRWLASGHLCYVDHTVSGPSAVTPTHTVREGVAIAKSVGGPGGDGGYSPPVTFPNKNAAGTAAAEKRVPGTEADMAASVAGSNQGPELRAPWQRRRLAVLKGKQSVRIYLRDYAASGDALRLSAEAVIASLRLPEDVAVSVTANGRDIAIKKSTRFAGLGEETNG